MTSIWPQKLAGQHDPPRRELERKQVSAVLAVFRPEQETHRKAFRLGSPPSPPKEFSIFLLCGPLPQIKLRDSAGCSRNSFVTIVSDKPNHQNVAVSTTAIALQADDEDVVVVVLICAPPQRRNSGTLIRHVFHFVPCVYHRHLVQVCVRGSRVSNKAVMSIQEQSQIRYGSIRILAVGIRTHVLKNSFDVLSLILPCRFSLLRLLPVLLLSCRFRPRCCLPSPVGLLSPTGR